MVSETFRAAVIHEHGGYDKILFEDRQLPPAASAGSFEDRCLIEVTHCGINHLDTWVRKGVPGHKFPLPLVPGSDIVGIVKSSVGSLKQGDRVLVNPGLSCGECEWCVRGSDDLCVKWGLLGETADGGCQQLLFVNSKNVFVLPAELTSEQAACIPINYVTAWEMLVNKAKIQKGETLLIHSAGSGVSVAALQIALHFGCRVIVTSTSEEKLLKAQKLFPGIEAIFCPNPDGVTTAFAKDVRRLTDKRGVDVVVDHLGKTTLMESVRSLRRGGRLVSCGATTGAKFEIEWNHIFFKNIALLGSTYGNRATFKKVCELFAEKKLRGLVQKVLAFGDLPLAHELLETKAVFGKIIVKVS